MQVATCVASPDPVYAEADTTFAQTKAYLSSREAQQMRESDLERELHRRGQELIRQLLQGHLDQRGPGETAGPVAGADGVERPERRVHERRLETTFGTVDVERVGYGARGHESLHPLDASLNLPPERYSLFVIGPRGGRFGHPTAHLDGRGRGRHRSHHRRSGSRRAHSELHRHS